MTVRLTPYIKSLTKDLIQQISGFEEGTKEFKLIEKFAHSHIDSYHYYFNDNRNDIEKIIDSLSDKFNFHGFVGQAADLKKCSKKFFDSSFNKEDLDNRLAVIKLLVDLSECPTAYFIEHPEKFKERYKGIEEQVDWSNFLNETKVPIKEKYIETSDLESWSDSDNSFHDEVELLSISLDLPEVKSSTTNQTVNLSLPIINQLHTVSNPIATQQQEVIKAQEELINCIQTEWWNRDNIQEKPNSIVDEANVALKWDKFVNHESMGFVNKRVNVISEYKIMREIIWQFYSTHSCFSYSLVENTLVPKDNVTIASVRSVPLKNFLQIFVPYFLMLKTFRDFQESLLGAYFTPSIPDTYRSYNCAIQDILRPVFEKIRDIENIIRKQEETYTLLTLARDIQPYFKKVEILFGIHKDLMPEFTKVDNSFISTTYLLSRLYFGLLNSVSKTEQNIYLTLYLESLYKYFTIIEKWLTQDLLEDLSDEFIIVDMAQSSVFDKTDYDKEFCTRKLENYSKSDGMLNIVSTIVLQLGKNIHLLRQLGKLHLVIDEYCENYETLHQEYTRTVLEEIFKYLHVEKQDVVKKNKTNKTNISPKHEFVICPEIPKSSSGMDDLKNYLDTSDGFLMSVFEKYIFHEQTTEKPIRKENLYDKIDNNIDRIVPTWQILETKFKDVLKKRYSFPGLMVKDILISQYQLKKHFSLIRRLFLFEDDLLFPFYKKMFGQFEENQPWGNFFWLTSQIQDLLMDHYPEFYEYCRVDVSPNWRSCISPIQAWDLVSVHYKVDWPVNLIIQDSHMAQYGELFQFLMKIKWAMYTLNSLNFEDIQPRATNIKSLRYFLRLRIRRLQLMRFRLLNDISSVQHYILGHLFNTVLNVFNRNLEESYDLETLTETHNRFVNCLYMFCRKLRDYCTDTYGFAKVLILVQELKIMWQNIEQLEEKHLKKCEVEYLQCNKYLRPIIEVDVLF